MVVQAVLAVGGVALVVLGLLLIRHRDSVDRWCGELSSKVGWDLYRAGSETFFWFGSGMVAIGLVFFVLSFHR